MASVAEGSLSHSFSLSLSLSLSLYVSLSLSLSVSLSLSLSLSVSLSPPPTPLGLLVHDTEVSRTARLGMDRPASGGMAGLGLGDGGGQLAPVAGGISRRDTVASDGIRTRHCCSPTE